MFSIQNTLISAKEELEEEEEEEEETVAVKFDPIIAYSVSVPFKQS